MRMTDLHLPDSYAQLDWCCVALGPGYSALIQITTRMTFRQAQRILPKYCGGADDYSGSLGVPQRPLNWIDRIFSYTKLEPCRGRMSVKVVCDPDFWFGKNSASNAGVSTPRAKGVRTNMDHWIRTVFSRLYLPRIDKAALAPLAAYWLSKEIVYWNENAPGRQLITAIAAGRPTSLNIPQYRTFHQDRPLERTSCLTVGFNSSVI